MSNKGQLLQDPFLNLLRKEHVPVSIYLVYGIKLQGHIESFDQYVVLLRNTLHDAFRKAMFDPAFVQEIAKYDQELAYLGPTEYEAACRRHVGLTEWLDLTAR